MSVSFLQLGISCFSVLRGLRARYCFYLALRRKGGRKLDVGAKRVHVIYLRYEGCNRAKRQSKEESQVFFEVTENYL